MSLEGADWAAECPRAPVGQLDERRALSRSCNEKYERKCEKKSYRATGSASPPLPIFPLSWVEDPEWILFLNWFLPKAKLVSQKVLTQRLIPSQIVLARRQTVDQAAQGIATGHCDE